jgi:hypothetical protein
MGLDTIEFLMLAEKEFGITITDAEAGEIYTVGQFSRLCHTKLQAKPNNTLDEPQVFSALAQILREQFTIKKPVEREDLIVKDLRMG